MRQPAFKTLLVASALVLGTTASFAQKPDKPQPTTQAPNSRAEVKADAAAEHKSTANTLTPAGEPSTMTNNQPNVTPKPTGYQTRAEVRETTQKTKPQFGQKGERPDVPTNPTSKTGTPQ